MAAQTIAIKGMACDGCVAAVREKLQAVAGVSEAQVSLEPAQAQVIFDQSQTGVEQLLQAVRAAGYEGTL